jgi:hypothetical protein
MISKPDLWVRLFLWKAYLSVGRGPSGDGPSIEIQVVGMAGHQM